MTPVTMYLYLTVLIVAVHAVSIEKVSEKQRNVTKRAANGDFFPDWVPFKNKHGDELGEFQQVAKAKPKKRLAPPVNFILRAVAEPEGDDYYDKGQGESDGEEYFEKKDWSDLNRPAESVDTKKALNHTDISDIDGVVNIITKGKPSVILNALKQHDSSKKQKQEPQNSLELIKSIENESKQENDEEKEDETENTEPKKTESRGVKPKDVKKEIKKPKKYEDDIDYEESDSEKSKPEIDDQSENDAKKASILDSVDELKERHAEEQKAISEKAKEDEIDQEEHEKNKIGGYEKLDKYQIRGRKKDSDYDEYDDKELSVHEKYKIHPSKATTTTRRPLMGRNNKKSEEVGKMSVFKNPQLFMVYDDDSEDEDTTKKPTTKSSHRSRISSRFTTATPETPEENVRISLVPLDPEAKEGEPTLFFPKTRKNKKRRKNKTTTPEPDSSVAESVPDTSAKDLSTSFGFTGTSPSASDITSSGTSPSGSGITSSGSDTSSSGLDTTASGSSPSASDTAATNTKAVTDAVPASTDHKDEKKHEDYHKEKGKILLIFYALNSYNFEKSENIRYHVK